MYWTLFLVALLPDGKIDYNSGYEVIQAYETRLECELAIGRVERILGQVPEGNELLCLRTDEA